MKKKLVSFILAATMIASLCGCGSSVNSANAAVGSNSDNTEQATDNTEAKADDSAKTAEENKEQIKLKVWGAQGDQDLLKELCEEFASEHPENDWEFEYGVVGEADAQAR